MHALLKAQLDKLDCQHLQAWIVEHADASSLNHDTQTLMQQEQLSMVELLSIALLANEGLVLFKRVDTPHTDKKLTDKAMQYEAIFKHVEAIEHVEKTASNTPTTPATQFRQTAAADTDNALDKLIENIDLDADIPTWLHE